MQFLFFIRKKRSREIREYSILKSFPSYLLLLTIPDTLLFHLSQGGDKVNDIEFSTEN